MTENGSKVIEQYLEFVRSHLPAEIADDVVDELRVYLVEAATDLGNGELTEKSAKKAVARFGAPSEVAKEYQDSIDLDEEPSIEESDESPEEILEHEVRLEEKSKTLDSSWDEKHRYSKIVRKAILLLTCYFVLIGFPFIIYPLIINTIFYEWIIASSILIVLIASISLRNTQLQKDDVSFKSPFEKLLTFPVGVFESTPRVLFVDIIISCIGFLVMFTFLVEGLVESVSTVLWILIGCRVIFSLSNNSSRSSKHTFTSVLLDFAILYVIHFGYYVIHFGYLGMINQDVIGIHYILYQLFGMIFSIHVAGMLFYKIQSYWWTPDIPESKATEQELKTPEEVMGNESTETSKTEEETSMKKIEAKYAQTFGKMLGLVVIWSFLSFWGITLISQLFGWVSNSTEFYFSMVSIQTLLATCLGTFALVYQSEANSILWTRQTGTSPKKYAILPENAFRFESQNGLKIDLVISLVLVFSLITGLLVLGRTFESFLILLITIGAWIIRIQQHGALLNQNKDSMKSSLWMIDLSCFLLLNFLIAIYSENIYGVYTPFDEAFLNQIFPTIMILLVLMSGYLLLKLATTMHLLWRENDTDSKNTERTKEKKLNLVELANAESIRARNLYFGIVFGLEIFTISIFLISGKYYELQWYLTKIPFFIGSIIVLIMGLFAIKSYYKHRTSRIEDGSETEIYGTRGPFESFSDLAITSFFAISLFSYLSNPWIYDVFQNQDTSLISLIILAIFLVSLSITSRIFGNVMGLIDSQGEKQHKILYFSYLLLIISGYIFSFLLAISIRPFSATSLDFFIGTGVQIFILLQLPICFLGVLTILRLRLNASSKIPETEEHNVELPSEGPQIASSEGIS